MPSFASFVVLAMSAVSVFAGSLDGSADAHQLEKRRPNHADEYGYPHNRGPHVDDGRPMRPGGFRDPYPNNLGSRCRFNAQCHYNRPLSLGYCTPQGRCDFRCIGSSVKMGRNCVGSFRPGPVCRRDRQCPQPRIRNAQPDCNQGRCTFRCNRGFHAEGNRCVRNAERCEVEDCPVVDQGFSTCNAAGQCEPGCATYLGYTLFTDGDNNYRCVNLLVDPANCGTIGNTCETGYNGLGVPTCGAGVCGLNCAGYAQRTLPNGQSYCSSV